ncbi:YnfU family zinc-binding protein [Citrobacter enshiensis]|uniref:YnfU family zinc-binding protein n=1 Tax=Citrobacter enshiensis TaxID=2971264 RepID=A0ABT8PUS3_9ENTR|nr:YnfU family zinc-binding protein [Citrobacter enshiensis]WET38893.1 YnfU family zinc-binding protein [Citrobacter enshiensis]
MSYTSGLRKFKERPVHVTCPACNHRADQKAGKLRKDAVLECPSCGLLFLPSECWCIGG